VSPVQRHDGCDHEILARRHELYLQGRERNPRRWSRTTRDWSRIDVVTLNPEHDSVMKTHLTDVNTQQAAA
jgi:hypothetical protein